jgi:hypothetical protein
MTAKAAATHNFVGALNELTRLCGIASFDEKLERINAACANLSLDPIPRSTLAQTLSLKRKECPDWSNFCRPLLLACFEAGDRPGTTACEFKLDLGSEKDWRRFHGLAENGYEGEWPFRSPEPYRTPGLSEEERMARAIREKERARVLSGAGVLSTLRNLYPDHGLTDLWSLTFPITTFPAPRAEWHHIESPLGRTVGQLLPGRLDYSDQWDPNEGRQAFDASNLKYEQLNADRRRFFFSGSTFAFHALREEAGGVRLDVALGRYFASHATSEDLDPEMMFALAKDPEKPVSLRALPRRSWLHQRVSDPVVDGQHRSGAISHATVVLIRNDAGGYKLLLPPRSDDVAAHAHFHHVAPSGILSPHSEETHPPAEEFSIERNFFREWVEELYAADEHERPPFVGPPDPAGEPEVLRLKEVLGDSVELLYTGVSVNLLTLRPEICLLLLVKDPSWWPAESQIAAQSGRPVKLGWEYSDAPGKIRHQSPNQPDGAFISLDENLQPPAGITLTPDFLVPNAAAAIALALPVVHAFFP